ncbi:hypothetical protein C4D60_Mb01t09290 [Musa balbisiana]|uniref:Uncharacterized protein n=1 Tax=Musa balbisiana TaxID=52838 RepID=A0A4S8JNE0_MUSBA|nr:hypothetical protein C4D60_Mb01t09290 [Musa balbisiana]
MVAKRHVVGPGDPADPDCGEGVERHEGGVDGPLLLHDTAVEDDEPRHALQADERGRDHLPCVVALVEPVGHGGSRLYGKEGLNK